MRIRAVSLCGALFVLGLAFVFHQANPASAAPLKPGALDVSFGKRGKVVTDIGPRLYVADVAAAPKGGVYVAANTGPQGANFYGGRLVVLRYDRRGRLVRRFGRRGVSTVSFPLGPAAVSALAVQPDGRLIVVGSVGGLDTQDLLVVRLDHDGTLDGSFAVGGMHRTDFGGRIEGAADVAIQPDGALVLAGSVDTKFPGSGSTGYAVVVRVLSDGQLDSAFGTGGIFRVAPPADGYADAQAVARLTGGDILVGGNSGVVHRDINVPFVARLRSDGSLDTTAGNGGFAYLMGATRYLRDMVIDHRRARVYVAGSERKGPAGTTFFAAAVGTDLTLASDFGGSAVVNTSFRRTPLDIATALTLDGRRRLVLVGTAAKPPEGWFGIARFRPDGALDRRFGHHGRARVKFGRGWNAARAVLAYPRGRLQVVGSNGGHELDETGPAVTLVRLGG